MGMSTNLDQALVINAAMERKAKQFDKTISEMKGKVDRLSFDLDVNQKETRNASSELFKVKSAYEETVLQAALETEAKGKAEALRMKKKLESDAGDLGLDLEHA